MNNDAFFNPASALGDSAASRAFSAERFGWTTDVAALRFLRDFLRDFLSIRPFQVLVYITIYTFHGSHASSLMVIGAVSSP